MKILQINSVCGIGSTGKIATDLHKILIEQGYDSYIAYGRGKPRNCEKTIKIGNNIDVFIHFLISRLFDKHGFGSRLSTKIFIKKIKVLDPDVIHLHNIHGYYINIELLFNYLKESKKKVVWTLHDCWAFTGHCAYFDFIKCEKWKICCDNCPQLKSYPRSFSDNSKYNFNRKKSLFNNIDDLTLITPSNWLKSIVEESFLSTYRTKVIKNGIDLGVFKPVLSNTKFELFPNYRFIILGVANEWTERKGLKTFIQLANLLNENELIVLVGLSDRQIKGLPKNIYGIKKTQNLMKLVDLYSCANVFINPSFEETMGLVCIEAIACGTPIIVNNKTALPEVANNNCGLSMNTENIDDLINEVREFCQATISINEFISVAKEYDYKNNFLMYIKEYCRDKEEI